MKRYKKEKYLCSNMFSIKNLLHIFRDSLLKNSIYLMGTSFITGGIGFFFWVIAAKYYTPNDIGTTSAIFSGVSLVSMASSLGLSNLLIYYLPRDRNTEIINSCLVINIISSIMFSLIFILGIRMWSPGLVSTLYIVKNILIFTIVTTTISISGLIGAAFTAGRRSSFQMIKETTYHVAKILPLIFFTNFGAMGITISLCIGLLLSVTIGFILLFKTWNYIPKLTFDPMIMNMIGFSTGNYIASIFNSLPIFILPIIILNMTSAKSTGYFYIAIMMASLLYGISGAISNSFLVESSDKDKFWNNVNKSIKFNMIVLVPGLLLFLIFGKLILNIFNVSYAENATVTMTILVVTSIPLSMVTIFNAVRNAQNRVVSVMKMNLIIALLTILLSILLIKIMSIEGAAISYLVANTVGALVVISRIKNPKEFTLKLLSDFKSDVL